jgi:DNA-binding response OmpR family regulator
MNNVQVLLIDEGEVPAVDAIVNRGRGEQFRFTQAPTLCQGLDALQEPYFHLVLLNLSLPDASVAESIAKILKKARDLPVIALVNRGETTKAAEALYLGLGDYVVKGCGCESLVQTMHHVLERKQLMAEAERARQPSGDAQLTAHLSHELRNALACIHQFGTILIDGLAGKVTEEQREYLCIMLENASSIRTVLDNALEGAAAPEINAK